ncbi:hypothetical protein CYMTET_28675 [Cymbomonas tetramitiformis]|uniref:ABC transporter permease n=1 Tax=Cymbomonas tetramitiformis TaxID=36881 RepID=A0AAE0KVY3_9CHLO|nr:hypothetical protein CYMTET_28675 [Cymbomonas tetramitiformis]
MENDLTADGSYAISYPASDEAQAAESVKDAPSTPKSPSDTLRNYFRDWNPPAFLWRGIATLLLTGQVFWRLCTGKLNLDQTQEQMSRIGPQTLGVSMLTASFVGMVFTIQFTREFARLGLTKSVGGVLALAFSRELTPVITAIIVAGRVGSAIAAELGTMQVSEQTDSLRVLQTDPVDYLIAPRVVACMLSVPVLSVISFTVAMAASVLLADLGYGIMPAVILDSARKALVPWDFVGMTIKSVCFGWIVAIISCGWGSTTSGGAKGVGESTTASVVISLIGIFIGDFLLSVLMFQGTGTALKKG